MSNDIEFVNGLSFKAPNDGAPDYVKSKGWIKNAEMIAFLQSRIDKGEESTNFDLKVSQGGKWYAAVNNWKPNGEQKRQEPARQAPANDLPDFQDDAIPFDRGF